MYSRGVSEEVVGRALRDFARARPGGHRDQGVLPDGTTAPTTAGCRASTCFDAIDASLRRLGIDYVDLYQIHRFDPETPIEETLEALHDVVKAGKARYIGASSMYAWQFAKALYLADRHGWTRFVSMQNHYNLIYREEEREMLPLCRDEGIGVIPWSPLARGFLAGNRRREDWGDTARAKTDDYGQRLYYSDADFAVADARGRGGEGPRREADPGGAGLDARAARRHVADRRRVAPRAPGRRRRRPGHPAVRRRAPSPRRAVPPARRARAPLSAPDLTASPGRPGGPAVSVSACPSGRPME